MSIHKWLQEGFDKGYCSDVSCETHETDYYTEEEIREFNSGEDPCIFVVRINDTSFMALRKYTPPDIPLPPQ